MSRRIVFEPIPRAKAQATAGLQPEDGGEAPPGQSDTPLQRVGKLIPAETLTFYVGVSGFLGAIANGDQITPETASWIQFAMCLLGLVGTWFIVCQVAKPEDPAEELDRRQPLLSTLAFVVWAFAVSLPLAAVVQHDTKWIGGLGLWVFTFITAFWPGSPHRAK